MSQTTSEISRLCAAEIKTLTNLAIERPPIRISVGHEMLKRGLMASRASCTPAPGNRYVRTALKPIATGVLVMKDWWDRPVCLIVSDTETCRVERMEKAEHMLLNGWPDDSGPAYSHAREALTKALQDPTSDSARKAARLAFTAAADEAGILSDDA
ncbi:MAG: DUF982 domain-containing protein [Aquamicrobium sp.]|nr:DUF982 domain-containing protein [Aquamicrobium sp.]